MTIHIDSLHIDAVIGLLDFEREREQPVTVDLEAEYRYMGPETFIDYALLAEMIEAKVKESRYRLLEESLLDLKRMILKQYPSITKLRLKISKPEILKNCTVALSQSWEFPESEPIAQNNY